MFRYKPRFKEIGDMSGTWTDWTGGFYYDGALKDPPGLYTGSYQSALDYRSIYGYDIVNFHKLKAQGALLPLTLFYQFAVSGAVSGNVNVSTYPDGHTSAVFNRPDVDNLSAFWVTKEDMDLVIANYDAKYWVQAAAARLATEGWDALTFAAELKSTFRLFSGNLQKIVRLAQTNGKKGRTALHDMWLEGRYGWRTLVYDMQDIASAINHITDEKKRYSERAGTSVSWESEVVTEHAKQSRTDTMTITSTYSLSMRGHVVGDFKPPRVQINPVTTAWEIVTLSFVVDWFINVGQWFASMTYLTFTQEHVAAEGFYLNLDRTVDISTEWNTGYGGTINTDGNLNAVRTVRLPAVVPTYPLPTVRLDFSKILDLLSLLIQRI